MLSKYNIAFSFYGQEHHDLLLSTLPASMSALEVWQSFLTACNFIGVRC